MSTLPVRARFALLSVALLLSAVLVALGDSPASAGTPPGSAKKLEAQCIRLLTSGSDASAAPGTASPAVVSAFAPLATPAPSTEPDWEPSLSDVLGIERVSSYDPDAERLLTTTGSASAYLIPATLAAPITVPAQCSRIKALHGLSDVVALENMTGSGPGLCSEMASPEATGSTTNADSPDGGSCVSLSADGTYAGLLSFEVTLGGKSYAIVPNGVSSVVLRFADGHQSTIPVTANLATMPQGRTVDGATMSIARIRAELAAALPTSIVTYGADGQVLETLDRPADLINIYVKSFAFEKRLLDAASSTSQSTQKTCSSRGACTTVTTSTTCDSKGKDCETVTRTQTCTSKHRCRTTTKTARSAGSADRVRTR